MNRRPEIINNRAFSCALIILLAFNGQSSWAAEIEDSKIAAARIAARYVSYARLYNADRAEQLKMYSQAFALSPDADLAREYADAESSSRQAAIQKNPPELENQAIDASVASELKLRLFAATTTEQSNRDLSSQGTLNRATPERLNMHKTLHRTHQLSMID